MTASIIKWIIILAATANFGFMIFDGTRALTTGDYLRPETGEYAGQLGPWSKIVASLGIDPESTLMKGIFVVWGLLGLTITLCFAMGISWAGAGLLIISICSLWYLIAGTGLSVLQIILLMVLKWIK